MIAKYIAYGYKQDIQIFIKKVEALPGVCVGDRVKLYETIDEELIFAITFETWGSISIKDITELAENVGVVYEYRVPKLSIYRSALKLKDSSRYKSTDSLKMPDEYELLEMIPIENLRVENSLEDYEDLESYEARNAEVMQV